MSFGKNIRINKLVISVINPYTLIIFILFYLAKILGYVNWSWWLVFSPLWIPSAILIGGAIIVGLIYLILLLISKI